MNKRKEIKKLIFLTILTSKILARIKDDFFKRKLLSKLLNLLTSYVAQSSYQELRSALNNFLETVDYAIYYKLFDATPLLLLKRKTLKFRLLILKNLNTPQILKEKLSRENIIEEKPKQLLTSNKDKILGFIKNNNKIRTKDIIGEFNNLSERTVKRTLKELSDLEGHKAVYYS